MNFITIPLVGPHINLPHLSVSREYVYGTLIALTVGLAVRGAAQVMFQMSSLLWAFGAWNLFLLFFLICRPGFLAGRMAGPYNLNPNLIAMVYLPIVGLNLVHFLHQKRKTGRVLSGVGLALGIVMLYLTKTRFALLTLIFVTIPLAVFLSPPKMKARKKISIIVVGLILISLAAGILWSNFEAVERKSMLTVNGRIEVISLGWTLFLEGPWYTKAIGYGTRRGLYQGAREHFGLEKPHISPDAAHAHNTFLQILLEIGVIGLVLMSTCLAWIALYSFKAMKSRDMEERIAGIMIFVFILTFFVMSQMDYSLARFAGKMNWFLIGLAISNRDVGRMAG